MKVVKLFARRMARIMSVVAIVLAVFNSLSIKAQGDEEVTDEVIGLVTKGNLSCYTQHILDCGLNLGQQLRCTFNDVYAQPFLCEEITCYGSIKRRQCVPKSSS